MSIPPGPYYYYVDDQPGAEPVACEIFEADDALWARFPPTDEDDGAELLVEEMPGRFLHAMQVPSTGAFQRHLANALGRPIVSRRGGTAP